MITQRIATAIRQQDWTIILIEFILVIVGVLIALELDQWSDSRALDAQEIDMLIAEKDALAQNISDMENYVRTLTAVSEFGGIATESLESDTCKDQCWPELVAFFHASQWLDVGLSREVYDEMKRKGLPRDKLLREKLTSYYNIVEQSRRIGADLPRYRELVRSLIPAKTQQHLWAACFKFVGKNQFFMGDCESPEDIDKTRATMERIKATPEVESSLNYWLSTVTVVISTLHNQVSEAELMIEALSVYVENEQ